jgi:hypothetical protein
MKLFPAALVVLLTACGTADRPAEEPDPPVPQDADGPERPAEEPPGLAQGRCRSDADCLGGSRCILPGTQQPPQCGACSDLYPDECKADADCPAHERCVYEGPCGCGRRQLICKGPGCGPSVGCAIGQACDDQGHCGPISCTADTDCPVHWECTSGACARKACQDDDGCGGGYCLGKRCHPEPGWCKAPMAVPSAAWKP